MNQIKKITTIKLNEMIRDHELWLENDKRGIRADFSYMDLSELSLSCRKLKYADFNHAKLCGTFFVDTDLSYTDFRFADLSYAILCKADLRYSNLQNTNLHQAKLRLANLIGADIDLASLTISCKTLEMITDDRIKIQYLYHVAAQTGIITDQDLKKLMSSRLFKKVCNKFHKVDECGEIK